MKIFDKKYEIKIEEDDIRDAKLSSIDFSDQNIKKRAFIDVLGARLAMKILFSHHIEANNLYSLYTIHSILEELDIADIYFQGIKIDVRLVFNQDEIFIPKSHFQHNLLPDLYLVLVLKPDMSSVDLLGFFEPHGLNKNNQNEDFYFQEYENLHKPDELKNFLETFIVENNYSVSDEDTEKAKELFLSLTDNEISQKDKNFLFQQLAHNFSLREKIVEFENFEFISKEVAKSNDILQDSVLDVVGAQNAVEEGILSKAEMQEEFNEAIGQEEKNKKSKMGLDGLIAEAENEVFLSDEELEMPTETSDSPSDSPSDSNDSNINGIVAGGLNVLAAGLELGGAVAGAEVMAAATGVAGANIAGDLVEASIDSIIENLPDLNKTLVEAEEVANFELGPEEENDIPACEIEQQSVEKEDNLSNEIDNIVPDELIGDTLPELELPELDLDAIHDENLPENIIDSKEENYEENFVPQQEFDDSESKENDGNPEIDNFYDLDDFQEPAYLKQDTPEENVDNDSVEAEDFTYENINDTTSSELESDNSDSIYNENSEIDNSYDLDDLQEPAYLKQDVASNNDVEEKTKEDNVLNLDDFDFETMTSSDTNTEESQSIEDNLISFDDIVIPGETQQTKDSTPEVKISDSEFDFEIEDKDQNDNVQNFTNLDETEDEEDFRSQNSTPQEQSYDLLSEVDDFLNNMDLPPGISDEQKNTLDNEFNGLIDDDIFANYDLEPAGLPQKNSQSESYNSEDLEASIDELVDSAESDDDKDLLKVLFKKENFGEDYTENFNAEDIEENTEIKLKSQGSQNKKMVIAASIASVVLASVVIGGLTMHNNGNSNSPNNMTPPPAPISADASSPMNDPSQPSQSNDIMNPQLMNDQMIQNPTMQDPTSQALPSSTQQTDSSPDMGKAVSDAFLSEPVNASISKIAWEVPEDLAYNDNFRKYLQIAGKNLKLNLQNDLLLASEMAYSNKVIVDLNISRDGTLSSLNITSSSGSKQIDKIVLQSIKNTMKYLKMPTGEIKGASATATLIINF